MNCQTAIALLQNQPQRFYTQFEGIVFKIVDKFCEQTIAKNLQQATVFREVKKKLPNRLAKVCKKAKEEVYFLTILAKSIQILCNDILDKTLAEQKSPQLLLRYQPFVKMRVIALVNSQYFRTSDEVDVQQMTLQKILEKIRGGKLQQYRADDNALFSTYLKRIIENQFIDIHRVLYESQKRQQASELKPELVESQEGMSYHLFEEISNAFDREEQVKQLTLLLKVFPDKSRIKFETSLKTSYYLILLQQDAENLQLNRKQAKAFLNLFGISYQHVKSTDVWEKLNPYVCIFEGKETSAVNLRKWFTRYRNKILARIMAESLSDYNDSVSENDFLEMLFEKIKSDRMVGKAAYQWFREIVVTYYRGV
ncbi:MAG: hypothetical protein ACPGVB_16190 [Chitinophagales bacterium]